MWRRHPVGIVGYRLGLNLIGNTDRMSVLHEEKSKLTERDVAGQHYRNHLPRNSRFRQCKTPPRRARNRISKSVEVSAS